MILAVHSETLPHTGSTNTPKILAQQISQIEGVAEVQSAARRSRRSHPGRSGALAGAAEPGGYPRRLAAATVTRPRAADRAAPGLHHREQRSAHGSGRRWSADRRVSQRLAGAALRRRNRRSRARRTSASRWADNERRAVILVIQAPARRQRHRHRRTDQGGAARLHASIPPAIDIAHPDRSHADDPRLGQRRADHPVLTIALVVMVIFLFLRNFWATVDPQRRRAAVADRHLRA